MTLDEAIQHADEVAYQKDLESGFDTDNERYAMTDKERADCKECANEHRQLAEWLRELKEYRKQKNIFDKIKGAIKLLSNANPSYWHSGDMVEREEVLEIIDKYKESDGDEE